MSERSKRPLPPDRFMMPARNEEAGIVSTAESAAPVPDRPMARPRLAPVRA